MLSAQTRTALVTGAAKRIGRVIALALARSGWNVVVHFGRSAEEAQHTVRDIEKLGRRSVAVACDLSNESSVRTLLAEATAAIGADRISCIVNNASLFEPDSAADFCGAALDAHMHTNLAAPVLLAQALHQATPAGMQSVVVNLLDQKLFNLNPDFFSYTLSKSALQCATTMLAQALAPKVRIVGIAPGITLISGNQSPDGFARAHAVTPLGHSSSPEDIASAVCFAAESRSITGSTIVIDGGQHLISLPRDVMFLAQ
jgi:NAD(P)-dependent dehydrogenase (short-subunit alcohol dehydrogenase family)